MSTFHHIEALASNASISYKLPYSWIGLLPLESIYTCKGGCGSHRAGQNIVYAFLMGISCFHSTGPSIVSSQQKPEQGKMYKITILKILNTRQNKQMMFL